MRWLLGLLLLAPAFPSSPLFAQAGRLQQVREEVREPEQEKTEEDRKPSDPGWCPDDENDGASFLGEMLVATVAAPFWVPRVSIEGEDIWTTGYFPSFPYGGAQPGYIQTKGEEGARGRTWAGRFSLEYGTDFDGLEKIGGRVLLETTSRFGIQARVDSYREKLWCGCFDELTLGSTELTFRFAQGPHIQMYAGLGVRWLDDRFDTEWGFNFTYGADLFPVKPLVVSLSIDAGSLGDAGVFEARGTVGALFNRFEVFTGYEHRWIGSADLGSFLAGLRVWF